MNRVGQALDLDHQANLSTLARVEEAFASARPGEPDDAVARIAPGLVTHLTHHLPRHFAFEEDALFPALEAAGDGELAALLREEHVSIRAVADELVPLLRTVAAGALDAAGWRALKRAASELVEREHAHMEKETLALLPLLEQVLDDETDRRLAFEYAAG